ncbi:hypothetical protein GDO81_021023 [Engystomops pustulosus]|uniref:Uncharacterized protein n=1 Tax=Engystomops pustulosus TaxID=76066 RepID=A0AAV6YTC7_ENGPU|nr:hypothetical protein GDO81_021023 [Engystomops pustulosus]
MPSQPPPRGMPSLPPLPLVNQQQSQGSCQECRTPLSRTQRTQPPPPHHHRFGVNVSIKASMTKKLLFSAFTSMVSSRTVSNPTPRGEAPPPSPPGGKPLPRTFSFDTVFVLASCWTRLCAPPLW